MRQTNENDSATITHNIYEEIHSDKHHILYIEIERIGIVLIMINAHWSSISWTDMIDILSYLQDSIRYRRHLSTHSRLRKTGIRNTKENETYFFFRFLSDILIRVYSFVVSGPSLPSLARRSDRFLLNLIEFESDWICWIGGQFASDSTWIRGNQVECV